MNHRNRTLIFISMHPAHEHTLDTCKWIRGVCHPLCLRFPAQFCHLSPDQCICSRVYAHAQAHTQTSAFNLCFGGVSLALDHICLPCSQHRWTEGTAVSQVSLIEFKKTSEPLCHRTLYNNEMKRTMKDNNGRWLSEHIEPRLAKVCL